MELLIAIVSFFIWLELHDIADSLQEIAFYLKNR